MIIVIEHDYTCSLLMKSEVYWQGNKVKLVLLPVLYLRRTSFSRAVRLTLSRSTKFTPKPKVFVMNIWRKATKMVTM